MCFSLPGRGRQLQSPNTPETVPIQPQAPKSAKVSIESAVTSGRLSLFAGSAFTQWSRYVFATPACAV